MRFHTFGNKNNKAMVFIHGVLTPWQIWEEFIRHFSGQYYVVVPELDAHTEEGESFFRSVEDEAAQIEEYIIHDLEGNVFLIYGLSMGGKIAAKIVENELITVENVVLDGAPLVKFPKPIVGIMKKNYLDIIHKSKNRDPKVLESFKKNFLPDKYLDPYLKIADNMLDESIGNMMESVCCGYDFKQYKGNPHILFMHGTKGNESASKKSAIKMKKANQQTEIRCLKGYAHAQLACFEPQKCIEVLEQFFH